MASIFSKAASASKHAQKRLVKHLQMKKIAKTMQKRIVPITKLTRLLTSWISAFQQAKKLSDHRNRQDIKHLRSN